MRQIILPWIPRDGGWPTFVQTFRRVPDLPCCCPRVLVSRLGGVLRMCAPKTRQELGASKDELSRGSPPRMCKSRARQELGLIPHPASYTKVMASSQTTSSLVTTIRAKVAGHPSLGTVMLWLVLGWAWRSVDVHNLFRRCKIVNVNAPVKQS